MNEMTEEQLNELDAIRAETARHQANGDNKRANLSFMKEQMKITEFLGNRPIVGGRDPSSRHGSRGV